MNPFNPDGYGPSIGIAPHPPVVEVSPTCAVLLLEQVVYGVVPRTQIVPMGMN